MTKGYTIILFFSLYYLQHLAFLFQSEICLTYSQAEPLFLQVFLKRVRKMKSLWLHFFLPSLISFICPSHCFKKASTLFHLLFFC